MSLERMNTKPRVCEDSNNGALWKIDKAVCYFELFSITDNIIFGTKSCVLEESRTETMLTIRTS